MEIKIYSKTDCRFCRKTREFFAERGITVTEYDVDVDKNAKYEMIKNSRQELVPVIVRDNQYMQIGYDLTRLEGLISINIQWLGQHKTI